MLLPASPGRRHLRLAGCVRFATLALLCPVFQNHNNTKTPSLTVPRVHIP